MNARQKERSRISRQGRARADALPLIGWREWAALPDLGVDRINVKIDTGAESSALHASALHEIDIGGEAHVEFVLHPLQRRKTPAIACCERLAGEKAVRSSNGETQRRTFIRTRLSLGDELWEIDLTLADRGAMGFRMLIGRDALCGRCLVDPQASYLLGR